MKTKIIITGQINGNTTLMNAIECDEPARRGMFYSYVYEFKTKKEARKALWNAYKYLRSDGYTSLRYSPKRCLNYDASYARIEENK